MTEKDIISKDIFKQIAVDLANIFFGFDIQPQDQLTILETEHQRIQDRRADLVLKVHPKDKPAYILHIEIQNNYHPLMAQRMLSYYVDINMAHPNIPIHQYMVYIGKARLTMGNKLKQDQLDYEYGILDIRDIKCQDLMTQGTPDALVLAILCDFGQQSPQTVVNAIVEGLSEYCAENKSAYRRYILMLEILAGNRDLKNQIKEAEEMITQMKLEDLPSYEIGMEAGIEKGIEKGIERGIERGKIQSAKNLLNILTDETIATTLGLPLDLVKKLH